MNNLNAPSTPQDAWIKSAIEELDNSIDNMDSIDASRLQTARQIAYRDAASQRQVSIRTSMSSWLNWKSGLTLACTLALVATVTLNLNIQRTGSTVITAQTTQKPKPHVGINVIPLLTANEDLEFYESVNFLLWLEQKQGKS